MMMVYVPPDDPKLKRIDKDEADLRNHETEIQENINILHS